MNNLHTYWLTTELMPLKFAAENKETGELGETDDKAEVRKAALNRAHEIRKFEIDLYWKRATYFWLLQAAAFTAIGLTWKFAGTQTSPLIPVCFAALGAVIALAGLLSSKGSKFWQENWEYHIDMLEDEFEGRLHKTVYVGRDGLAWSVSGVNERLGLCFVGFWLLILGSTVFEANPAWLQFLPFQMLSTEAQTIGILLISLLGAAFVYSRRTKFTGAKGVSFREDVPVYEGSDCIDPSKLPDVKKLAKQRRPFLIRREPKA